MKALKVFEKKGKRLVHFASSTVVVEIVCLYLGSVQEVDILLPITAYQIRAKGFRKGPL